MSLYKEDVYETEDAPPAEEPAVAEEQFEHPEVEKIHLDVNRARKHFQILEADMNVERLEETFEQKFARLREEVQALVEEAERREAAEVPAVNREEIAGLRDLLKSVAQKKAKSIEKTKQQKAAEQN